MDIKELICQLADPESSIEDILINAASDGNTEIVKFLLEAKVNPNPNVQSNRWTALIWASDNGHTKIVKLLLEAKANPNVQSNARWTALMGASRYGHTKIVKFLLEAGANPNVPDPYGNTALSLTRNPEIKNLLIRAGAKT